MGTLSWLVFVREKPIKIRMMTGGPPMTQETTILEMAKRWGLGLELGWRCLTDAGKPDVQ